MVRGSWGYVVAVMRAEFTAALLDVAAAAVTQRDPYAAPRPAFLSARMAK
jgi:hypothetical protein